MSEAFPTWLLPTWLTSPNVTSSLASESGVMRSDSQDGLTTDPCGPEAAPANHSQVQQEVGTFDKRMKDTCGPIGDDSSLNARLERSLVNRLPLRAIGSMASAMTWKHWITPSGRRFCRLSLSVSIMRALGFTLWATPTVTANQAAPSMAKHPGCRGIIVTPEAWAARMGIPAEWLNCAPSATPLFRKLRPNSSKPT